jgi:hypothetical protein
MRLAAVALAGFVASMSASAVHAASITQTATLAQFNLTSPFSTTLSVAQFNEGMGTLTSVQISLDGTALGSLQVRRGNNGFQGNVTYGATIGTDYTLMLDSQTLFVVDAETPVSVTAPRNATRTGTATTTGSASDSATFNSEAALLFFSGLGTVTFDIDIASENTVDSVTPTNVNQNPPFGVGTQTYTFTNQASAELTVTYTFAPIPEPLSLSLFGMSLLGLGLIRRATTRA